MPEFLMQNHIFYCSLPNYQFVLVNFKSYSKAPFHSHTYLN